MKIGDKYTLSDGGEAVVTEVSPDLYFCWAMVTNARFRGRLFPFGCSDGRPLAHESYGEMPWLRLTTETDLDF